jgi:hypothetical protein
MFHLSNGLPVSCCERGQLAVAPDSICMIFRPPFIQSSDPNQWRIQEFFFGGGGSTNSVEDRTERTGIWSGSPLVRGSGGSCNLVQEI